MVKSELIEALVGAFPGIHKQDMVAVVDTLFESMAEGLMGGETINLRGIGRFKVKERQPMRGRNPKTAASVNVPIRWVLNFKPADSLNKQIQ